jgi:DNA adenine methylase
MSRRSVDIVAATEVVMTALDACDLGDEEVRVTIEVVPPEAKPLTKADRAIEKAFSREVPILKTIEERYVLGVVLEPLKEMGMTDTQDDTYSAAEVRQACHKFMEDYGVMGLQHQINVTGRVKLVENTITRTDEVIDGQPVKAGTWLMGIRVVDEGLWKRVKDGSLTGFSIGGIAQRTPLQTSPTY